jgi:REP element-mobilizing transposase RayT
MGDIFMGSSLSNLLYHIVFSTKYREARLRKCEDEIYQCICRVIETDGGRVLAINGVDDHLHIAVRLLPRHSISRILQNAKGTSAKWINEKHISNTFKWQKGYGVFSISPQRLDSTIDYIKSQKIHHTKITFQDEYKDMLKISQIEYNENYIWD